MIETKDESVVDIAEEKIREMSQYAYKLKCDESSLREAYCEFVLHGDKCDRASIAIAETLKTNIGAIRAARVKLAMELRQLKRELKTQVSEAKALEIFGKLKEIEKKDVGKISTDQIAKDLSMGVTKMKDEIDGVFDELNAALDEGG